MKRLTILLLLISCWLFGSQIQAFAGINGSSHQSEKYSSIHTGYGSTEHIIDLITTEDDDEDLVKKYASAVRYFEDLVDTFIAEHSQLNYSPATPGLFSYAGTPKYITQRVLRI